MSYRVTVDPITHTIFTVLSLAVLVWSLLALSFCWFFGSPSPNGSQFPEVNFAAKITANDLVVGLRNNTDKKVIKVVGGKVLYVGTMLMDNGAERVAISTKRGLKGLRYKQLYL